MTTDFKRKPLVCIPKIKFYIQKAFLKESTLSETLANSETILSFLNYYIIRWEIFLHVVFTVTRWSNCSRRPEINKALQVLLNGRSHCLCCGVVRYVKAASSSLLLKYIVLPGPNFGYHKACATLPEGVISGCVSKFVSKNSEAQKWSLSEQTVCEHTDKDLDTNRAVLSAGGQQMEQRFMVNTIHAENRKDTEQWPFDPFTCSDTIYQEKKCHKGQSLFYTNAILLHRDIKYPWREASFLSGERGPVAGESTSKSTDHSSQQRVEGSSCKGQCICRSSATEQTYHHALIYEERCVRFLSLRFL